ncbi:MAG: DoxX family membrane protein [Bacteroidales bacterium]|jgi:thiosulfate dehydrogenase [quinone] large subunit|nr:DoxX family membrane protein [Bacteroidales bacterium]
MKVKILYTTPQLCGLVVLRVLVGWHFLYEGIVKILNPKWTSYAYLMDAKGIFRKGYHFIADNPGFLKIVNILNEWGLFLIGLSLITGCLTRMSTIGAMALLAVYYLSHIPFVGADYLLPSEGAYLWVDKNLIEIAVLFVLLVFPTSRITGIDRFIFKDQAKVKPVK